MGLFAEYLELLVVHDVVEFVDFKNMHMSCCLNNANHRLRIDNLFYRVDNVEWDYADKSFVHV